VSNFCTLCNRNTAHECGGCYAKLASEFADEREARQKAETLLQVIERGCTCVRCKRYLPAGHFRCVPVCTTCHADRLRSAEATLREDGICEECWGRGRHGARIQCRECAGTGLAAGARAHFARYPKTSETATGPTSDVERAGVHSLAVQTEEGPAPTPEVPRCNGKCGVSLGGEWTADPICPLHRPKTSESLESRGAVPPALPVGGGSARAGETPEGPRCAEEYGHPCEGNACPLHGELRLISIALGREAKAEWWGVWATYDETGYWMCGRTTEADARRLAAVKTERAAEYRTGWTYEARPYELRGEAERKTGGE
jgi:hypothetical protein